MALRCFLCLFVRKRRTAPAKPEERVLLLFLERPLVPDYYLLCRLHLQGGIGENRESHCL